MTDASGVPPEFVSYVEQRLPVLEGAALRLTGHDASAEQLSREMLQLVALRWGRLSKADTKHGLSPPASADAYLTRLFRHEAEELSVPQAEVSWDAAAPRRRGGLPPRVAADEAEVIWRHARRTVKRRWILAAIAAGTAGVLALCQTRDREPEAAGQPVPETTVLPPGTDTVPAVVSTRQPVAGLPAELSMPALGAALLSVSPVAKGLVLITAARVDTSPIFVLGSDGGWRHVDQAPEFAALWLHAGSLAPDGQHAAFGTPKSTVVVNLRTGLAKSYPPATPTYRPTWLTAQHLILGKDQMIDVVGGGTILVPAGPEDVLTPQNPVGAIGQPLARLSQLLSVGEPVTAAARAQRWVLTALGTPLTPVSQPLRGPIGDLIGPWRDQGFASGNGFAVRACTPAAIPSLASTTGLVVAARLDGQLVRAIVAHRPVSIRALGWLDDRRALLGLISARQQQIVAWDVLDGRLTVASRINSDGVLSLADPTSTV